MERGYTEGYFNLGIFLLVFLLYSRVGENVLGVVWERRRNMIIVWRVCESKYVCVM